MSENQNYSNVQNQQEEEGSGINIRAIWDVLILKWQWFVLSVVLCMAAAFFYLRVTPSVFSTTAQLLIKDEDPYSKRMQGNSMVDLTQLGFMSASNGFDNEVEILGSKTLALRVVRNLKLYVNYTLKGTFRDKQLFGTSPVTADMQSSVLDSLSGGISMTLEKFEDGYHIEGKYKDQEFSTVLKKLPGVVRTPAGSVTLTPSPSSEVLDRPLVINIVSPRIMASAYLSRLSIEPLSKTTTIAALSMTDTRPERSEAYMNELIKVYNEDANETKNEAALKTEAFINERIRAIGAELGGTEGELERFKRDNSLVNLESDAQSAYRGAETYQTRQVEIQIQMMLVKSLIDYVNNPDNANQVIPVNLGLTDNNLNNSISEYNKLIMSRSRALRSSSEKAPLVVDLDNKIAAMYPAIRNSLTSLYDNLRLQKRNVDEQYNLYISRLGSAPSQERILTDIGRQQEIKATLYQVLLQKREENAISLASTATKAQVIDSPETSINPIAPKKNIILLAALILGVAIPSGIFYLLSLMRIRIEGRNDIEKLTTIPVLADIFTMQELTGAERNIVVRPNSNGLAEEMFRNLRTNLGFVIKRSEKVIMITSVVPGEGKTFVSTNLALSYALMGRKVIVLGLDIRKPRLARLFRLNSGGNGLTNYLISEDASDEFLRKQIYNSGKSENLDVLPAGQIPPNPSELISSPRLDHVISRLSEWYDIIILDTPPIGLVSDTFSLARLAQSTLLVCRSEYSLKRNFVQINDARDNAKLPKISLVLNGVDLSQRKYSYYYGYGNYGHYGHYGSYGSYGMYGSYGGYGDDTSKGGYIKEDAMKD